MWWRRADDARREHLVFGVLRLLRRHLVRRLLRNGAGALAAAHETLRNGADPPGPSFLNARL